MFINLIIKTISTYLDIKKEMPYILTLLNYYMFVNNNCKLFLVIDTVKSKNIHIKLFLQNLGISTFVKHLPWCKFTPLCMT